MTPSPWYVVGKKGGESSSFGEHVRELVVLIVHRGTSRASRDASGIFEERPERCLCEGGNGGSPAGYDAKREKDLEYGMCHCRRRVGGEVEKCGLVVSHWLL